jgi:Protein of unknown function (DUF2744)
MIIDQEEVDWSQPDQHFTWALRNMPTGPDSGAIVYPGFLRQWSEHLWRCGFAHRDYLEGLADENGNIHVSQLPQQEIRYQKPFRGPHHHYNNAARWVAMDTPEPEPVRIPDIRELTIQENQAMLAQYRRDGWLKDGRPMPSQAEVMGEPDGAREE